MRDLETRVDLILRSWDGGSEHIDDDEEGNDDEIFGRRRGPDGDANVEGVREEEEVEKEKGIEHDSK
jgi:hypothetical protein